MLSGPQRADSPSNFEPQDCMRRNVSSNACGAIINRLPVELLLIIFSFATERPSLKQPYPYLSFSWVCHQWRSAILDNPVLWTTIVLNQRIDSNSLQELIRRSQSFLSLEVIVKNAMPSETVDLLRSVFKLEVNRVKTLYLDGNIHFNDNNLRFSELTSFFPCLENIFCDTKSKIDSSFKTPCVRPFLKALQISVGELGSLAVPGNFPQLSWLKLQCGAAESLISLLEALQILPNLQVLEFEPYRLDNVLADRRVTFRELRALITQCSIAQYINAPKLKYLKVDGYLGYIHNGHFGGFNLSGITRICFDISGNIFRITSYNDDEAASPSIYHADDKPPIFHLIPASYPNKLQITLEKNLPFLEPEDEGFFTMGNLCNSSPLFTGCVSKTTNLVEIFLRCPKSCIPGTFWNYEELIVFFTALKGATKTTKLHVSWDCCSFATLCQILSDGTLFPRLERLTYSSDDLQFFPDLPSLDNLMRERFATGRTPLEIGTQNFSNVSSEFLEKIQGLGIRLTPILEGEHIELGEEIVEFVKGE